MEIQDDEERTGNSSGWNDLSSALTLRAVFDGCLEPRALSLVLLLEVPGLYLYIYSLCFGVLV